MIDADEFETEIIMRSRKHDCHTMHLLTIRDIKRNGLPVILDVMQRQLKRFIEEKENATCEGKIKENYI